MLFLPTQLQVLPSMGWGIENSCLLVTYDVMHYFFQGSLLKDHEIFHLIPPRGLCSAHSLL